MFALLWVLLYLAYGVVAYLIAEELIGYPCPGVMAAGLIVLMWPVVLFMAPLYLLGRLAELFGR